MRNISISTFINTIFILALIAVISAFVFFKQWDQERYESDVTQRYSLIASAFLSRFEYFPTQEQLNRTYKYYHVVPLINQQDRLKILKNSKVLFIKDSAFGRMRVLYYKRNYFMYIQKYGYNLLLKDLQPVKYRFTIALLVFGFIIFVMMFLYIALMRKLSPLKKLKNQIDKFSQGDLDVKVSQEGKDEVAKVSQSFDNAISYINDLLKSKNLFMRNMMHELKTPITRGRIAVEMIEESEEKQVLINSYERMNEIVSELAQIEKITSNRFALKKEKFYLSELTKEAEALLMCKEEILKSEFKDFKLTVDRDNFVIILKNLMDNAIKFSPNKRVTIRANKKRIEIISKGDPLKEKLSHYTEPFSQEEKRSDGYGLGLYIVKNLLDAHGFGFSHRYENTENIFSIELKS